MIQEERRDYDTILDTFERIFSKYEKQVSLSLLGKPIGQYGSRIVAHMKSFAEQGYNVFFSDTFLEPEEFNTKLKGSDVVISPIRHTYKSIALEETYSHTKGSGAFADFVRFGKPTIVPGFYNIADEIKGSFIRYHNSNHLYDLLTDLIENPEKLLNWKSRAGEEASIFNLENLRKKFDMTVDEIFSEKKE